MTREEFEEQVARKLCDIPSEAHTISLEQDIWMHGGCCGECLSEYRVRYLVGNHRVERSFSPSDTVHVILNAAYAVYRQEGDS